MGALAVVVADEAGAEATVGTMLRAAPHRGTEVEVVASSAGALGISRDPSFPDAWTAARNGTVAAISGTLDNAGELRRDLARTGVLSDEDANPAAVLLLAFDRWGAQAFNRLRGGFAAAVLDGGALHCARDHVGLKPLFFREDDGAFFAASEAKQVLAGAGLTREPDVEAIEDMFYGRLSARTTALRGVSRFERATVAVRPRHKQATFVRYWDPRALLETARLSPAETRERLAEVLTNVVERSVSGQDAISLSGGIDSPTIAALAAPRHQELTGRPLPALTSVYPDHPTVDERRYTELVAGYLGLPLEAYVPSSQPLDDVQRWVDLVDGPVETLSLPELAENYARARSLGARTVLTGEMAEWVFTFNAHLIGHLVLHGRIRPALQWLREQRGYGGSWGQILRAAAPSLAPPSVARWYLRRRAAASGFAPAWIEEGSAALGARLDLARPARHRWLEHQLDPLSTPPATSLDADEICAAVHGITVKRPLADVDVWELLLSLPAERKFPSSLPKTLIRDVMRGRLPDEILDRRDKTGFSAWVLGTADWEGLRRWLGDPDPPISGVDYPRLLRAIERRDLNVVELMWAYDLARVHAFLDLWR